MGCLRPKEGTGKAWKTASGVTFMRTANVQLKARTAKVPRLEPGATGMPMGRPTQANS